MDAQMQRPDGWVMSRFRPPQYGPRRQGSEWRVQSVVLMADQRVMALAVDDQHKITMLTEQDGQACMAELGYPRVIFDFDWRVRGSVDFLANDRLKLEARMFDQLNKVALVCKAQQLALSDLAMALLKGQTLLQTLKDVRAKK